MDTTGRVGLARPVSRTSVTAASPANALVTEALSWLRGQRLKAINAGDQKIRCGRCESTDLPSLRDCHPLCLECISSLRLEGAVEWRLAAPAVSEAGGSPDCWGLLRDPATVLTDRATRPEHLCFQLLMESTERWANRTVPRSEARWHEQGCDCLTCQMGAPQALMRSGSRRALRYLRPWPLPVGKEVLAKAWSLGPFGLMEGRELYEVDWAPFEHDERAAIILDLSLEGVRVEAFGLVSLQRGRSDISGQFWEPTRPQRRGSPAVVSAPLLLDQAAQGSLGEATDVSIVFVDLRFRITGNALDLDVKQFLSSAQRWWGQFEGRVVRSGRPVGTGTFGNREEFIDVLRKLFTSPLTQEKAADELLVDLNTVKNYRKKFGFSNWAEVRITVWR